MCAPHGLDCYESLKYVDSNCTTSCEGLYADLQVVEDSYEEAEDSLAFQTMVKQYMDYKSSLLQNIEFNPEKTSTNFGSHTTFMILKLFSFSVDRRQYSALQLVQIFFATATFDKIEKDEKVTFEAQLGLIGGTMGLLTGFSILSAIEILYFLVKLFMSKIK